MKHNRKVQLIENELKQSQEMIAANNSTDIDQRVKEQSSTPILTPEEMEWNSTKTKVNLICKVSTELEIFKSIYELTQQV